MPAVYRAEVMPWLATLRWRKGAPFVFLLLAMSVVVSCVTVGPAPEGRVAAGAAAAEASAPTVASPPAPPPAPAVRPAASAAPAIAPAATLSLRPSRAPVAPDTPAPASAVPVSPASQEAGLGQRTVAKLQRILDNQVKNKGVAGLQAAVRLPGGELWVGTAGNAEFGPDRPIEDDTQFAIASVTKTFTAALILQLAEEGLIDLDAPFGAYFRDAPRKDKVTVRQLLSHTSGIHNYWSSKRYSAISRAWWETPGAGGLKARDHRWTYAEMLDLVKNGDFKPGEDYQYSNTNFLILGQVAEAVTGEPLHKLFKRRFFEPLGLDDTLYQPEQKPRADAAHGHWAWPGGFTDHTKDSPYVPFMAAASIADAAGAMASTAGDLAIWAGELYGGDVLSQEMLDQMTDFQRPGWYGLGADVGVFAGHRAYGHRGGIRGYESSMWYFPRSGVSVVLLSNQGNWSTDPVMNKLVKAVLGQAG